jgi:hypothetical protein
MRWKGDLGTHLSEIQFVWAARVIRVLFLGVKVQFIYLFNLCGQLFLKLDGGSCDRCTSLVKLLVS